MHPISYAGALSGHGAPHPPPPPPYASAPVPPLHLPRGDGRTGHPPGFAQLQGHPGGGSYYGQHDAPHGPGFSGGGGYGHGYCDVQGAGSPYQGPAASAQQSHYGGPPPFDSAFCGRPRAASGDYPSSQAYSGGYAQPYSDRRSSAPTGGPPGGPYYQPGTSSYTTARPPQHPASHAPSSHSAAASTSLKRAFESGDFRALVGWSNAHIPSLLGGVTPATGNVAAFLLKLEEHRYPLSLERLIKTLHLLTLFELAPVPSVRSYIADSAAKQMPDLMDSERAEIEAALGARAAGPPDAYGLALMTFARNRHLDMLKRVFVRILPLWKELAAHPDAQASAQQDLRILEMMRRAATTSGGRDSRASSIGDEAEDEEAEEYASAVTGIAGGGSGRDTARTSDSRDSAISVGGPASSVAASASSDKSARVTLSDASGQDEHCEKLGCIVRICSERPREVRCYDGHDGTPQAFATLCDPRKPWARPGGGQPRDSRGYSDFESPRDSRGSYDSRYEGRYDSRGSFDSRDSRGSGGYGYSGGGGYDRDRVSSMDREPYRGGSGGYGAPSRAPAPGGIPAPQRDTVGIDDLPAHWRRYSAPAPELTSNICKAAPGTVFYTCVAEEWRRGGPKTSLDGHGDLIFMAFTPELMSALRAAAEAVVREGLPLPRPPAVLPSPLPDAAAPAAFPGMHGSAPQAASGTSFATVTVSAPASLAGSASSGSGGSGSAGSPPITARSVPAAPLTSLPLPVMEPFRPLLPTPEHENVIGLAARYMRGQLLLLEVESKYVNWVAGGKNAAKRRQRHRMKLDEQAAQYGGVLARECKNDPLIGPATAGRVSTWAAINGSDRVDDLVLERLELASDAELDRTRYKFAVPQLIAAGILPPNSGAAGATGSAPSSAGSGSTSGPGSAGSASAPSPPFPGMPSHGGGGFHAGLSLYDSRGGTGSGGGRTHPGSSGYVMTPQGPQLLVDWKTLFPDGKMPRQRKRAKLMAQLEREIARGNKEDPTKIMARLAQQAGGGDE